MAVTGVRVRIRNQFENNSSPEFLGVSSITFSAGFDTMTLVGVSASGSTVTPASGQTVNILNCSRVEIIRSTLEFSGGTAGTPAE